MKRSHLIVFLVCFVSLFTSCSKRQTNGPQFQSSPDANGLGKAQSADWKVEITSAKPESFQPKEGSGGTWLLLKMRIEYVGPPGSVPVPPFVVRDEEWRKLKVVSWRVEGRVDDIPKVEASTWLVGAATDTATEPRTLKTGDKFEIAIFYYGDFKGIRTLLFADVPAIPFVITAPPSY